MIRRKFQVLTWHSDASTTPQGKSVIESCESEEIHRARKIKTTWSFFIKYPYEKYETKAIGC